MSDNWWNKLDVLRKIGLCPTLSNSVCGSALFVSLIPGVRGGSRISGKGVCMYKVMEVRFADFISFFLNIPWKWNKLVSLRPNYFSVRPNYLFFIWYLKTKRGRGFKRPPPPLNPLWILHWVFLLSVFMFIFFLRSEKNIVTFLLPVYFLSTGVDSYLSKQFGPWSGWTW